MNLSRQNLSVRKFEKYPKLKQTFLMNLSRQNLNCQKMGKSQKSAYTKTGQYHKTRIRKLVNIKAHTYENRVRLEISVLQYSCHARTAVINMKNRILKK